MTNEAAKTIADFLLGQLRYESKTTRKVLSAVPADGCQYKPSEKCMNGIALSAHIATAEAFFYNAVIDGQFTFGPAPELKTPAEVVAWYDEHIPALLAKIADLPAEKLAQKVDFRGMMNEPAVVYLALSLKHGIHHRGQLSSYLRPMGVKVPSIYGPSGDEEVQAAGR